MFGGDRSALRAFYRGAWRKRHEEETLEPLERLVTRVIEMHPEFVPVIEDASTLQRDFPEGNPYLHMGLHIALHEQLAADRPAGVRRLYQRILKRFADAHDAEHAMMTCLQAVMLDAQARGVGLDGGAERRYLSDLERLTKSRRR